MLTAELDGAAPREAVLAVLADQDDGTIVGGLYTFHCDASAYHLLTASDADIYESDVDGGDGLPPAGFAAVRAQRVTAPDRDALRVEWVYQAEHAWTRSFELLALASGRLETLFSCETVSEAHDMRAASETDRTIVIDDATLPARIRVRASWQWGPAVDDGDEAGGDAPDEGSRTGSSVFTYGEAGYATTGEDVCAIDAPAQ